MNMDIKFYGDKTKKADLFIAGGFETAQPVPKELQKIDAAAYEAALRAAANRRVTGNAKEIFSSYGDAFQQAHEFHRQQHILHFSGAHEISSLLILLAKFPAWLSSTEVALLSGKCVLSDQCRHVAQRLLYQACRPTRIFYQEDHGSMI